MVGTGEITPKVVTSGKIRNAIPDVIRLAGSDAITSEEAILWFLGKKVFDGKVQLFLSNIITSGTALLALLEIVCHFWCPRGM